MNRFFELSLVFFSGLVLLFILAPLLGMVLEVSMPDLLQSAKDPEVQDSIIITLLTAFGATLFFSIAAIPFAYLLAKKTFPLKNLINGIIDIPIVIPHTAAGIAILTVISRNSALGKLSESLGFEIIGTPVAISIAMAFVSIPFVINSARDGFAAVPERLEKAALNLGASPMRVFFTISIPLASKSIISGLVMMFARGMSEFGAVVIVAYHPMIAPVLIYERFGAYGLKYALPASVLFIVISLFFFILLRIFSKKK